MAGREKRSSGLQLKLSAVPPPPARRGRGDGGVPIRDVSSGEEALRGTHGRGPRTGPSPERQGWDRSGSHRGRGARVQGRTSGGTEDQGEKQEREGAGHKDYGGQREDGRQWVRMERQTDGRMEGTRDSGRKRER